MHIREQGMTTATPERCWELLSDVTRHGQWNAHVVDTQAWDGRVTGVGSRFRVTYELSGKRNEYDAEIVEWVPGSRFAARLEARVKGDGAHADQFVIESYRLEPARGGTRVVHDVRIEHDGLPWYWKLLVAFILTFGHPVGPSLLAGFASLAEAGDPAGAAETPRAASA
jgi:hypothetical protein